MGFRATQILKIRQHQLINSGYDHPSKSTFRKVLETVFCRLKKSIDFNSYHTTDSKTMIRTETIKVSKLIFLKIHATSTLDSTFYVFPHIGENDHLKRSTGVY